MITYVVYDANNHPVVTFSGPCRLARWEVLPRGWGIERFIGETSQGRVTLANVRLHAKEMS